MIAIFTDYGHAGPYLGDIESVLYRMAPAEKVIRLMVDVPRYNPRAGAYLLAALTRDYPVGTVFFAVVDPGVGSGTDLPVIFEADRRWYVGPDNGLFDILLQDMDNARSWHITWTPDSLSSTFHGRDLYAPVCAMLANNKPVPGVEITRNNARSWPRDLYEIIYVDGFGNLMTGVRSAQIANDQAFFLNGNKVTHADYFSGVEQGKCFWFENSYGLVELAVNRGSAVQSLKAGIGDTIELV